MPAKDSSDVNKIYQVANNATKLGLHYDASFEEMKSKFYQP
jgi:hypothetical protein